MVWDVTDEDLKKIVVELKKFNFHLENLKATQLKNLERQQEALLRQFEELKHEIMFLAKIKPWKTIESIQDYISNNRNYNIPIFI